MAFDASQDQKDRQREAARSGNPRGDNPEGGDKKKKKPSEEKPVETPPVAVPGMNYGNQTGFGGLSDIVHNQIATRRSRFGMSLATLQPSLASTTRRSIFGL